MESVQLECKDCDLVSLTTKGRKRSTLSRLLGSFQVQFQMII